ncbi:hypothetical protein [Lysinibacillus sp. NPDC056232]
MMFEEASDDRFVKVYKNSKIPIFLIQQNVIFHLQVKGLPMKQLIGKY